VDPKLVSFSPLAAAGGANVTIAGTGFGTSPVVHFSGSPGAATLGTHTATAVEACVPPDAHNGTITVSTANGDATSLAVFKPLLRSEERRVGKEWGGRGGPEHGRKYVATGVDPTAKLGRVAVTPGPVTGTRFELPVPAKRLT